MGLPFYDRYIRRLQTSETPDLWPVICSDTHWQTIGEKHALEVPDNLVGSS